MRHKKLALGLYKDTPAGIFWSRVAIRHFHNSNGLALLRNCGTAFHATIVLPNGYKELDACEVDWVCGPDSCAKENTDAGQSIGNNRYARHGRFSCVVLLREP
jgi:hypothetical protein